MFSEERKTIRNVGFLLTQRGLHILAGLLFAICVPRMMGPADFGRYALINSLYLWFVVGSDIGFTQMMGRFTPPFILQGEEEKLKKFFTNLLTISLLSGLIAGILYFSLTSLWLTDLDRFLFLIISVTLLIRGGTQPFFNLFLGLNQAGRWGMGETFRHWFLVFLLIIGFYLGKLRGALIGMLLTEGIVFFIGISWGRSYFSRKEFRLDLHYLSPYLKFGFIFLISNLLSSAFQYSGQILVRLFYSDYVEVGYFGLANSVYFTVSSGIHQLILSFAPLLMSLQVDGKMEHIKRWVERIISGLGLGMVLVFFGVLFLGDDLIPLVLGTSYRPVATNLLPLSLALWIQVLNNVGILLTIVCDRPKTAVWAAVIRLTSIWVLGPILIPKMGSFGGCLLLLLGAVIYSIYITWQMQKRIAYSLRKWIATLALGLLFFPLVWLRSDWSINLILYCFFIIGYFTLLLLFKLVKSSEVIDILHAFRSKRMD